MVLTMNILMRCRAFCRLILLMLVLATFERAVQDLFFSAFRGTAHPSLPPIFSLFTTTVPRFDSAFSTVFASSLLHLSIFS